MELNDTENVFPYIRRNQDNGDPPNIVHLLNNRQLGMRNKPVNQLKQFIELKTTLSEMKETQCQLPQSARSTFLMTFNSDCTKVASTHGDHNIYVCEVQTGKKLNKLAGHRRTPWCISFHPTIKDILASGCLAGEVRVWDLHGGSEKWQADSDQVIASLAFHPCVQLLVIATGNCLYFWDWSKSVPIASCSTYSEIEKVRFVKFDTYGNRLITGITNMSGNKSSMSGMRSALRSCVRLPPETTSLLAQSQQHTDSDRLYRGTSEERSRSPRRENAGWSSARTRSPVGGSIFPLRQDSVNRFIRHYRGEGLTSHRPERFSLTRYDEPTPDIQDQIRLANRSEMSASNREELASSNRTEQSSPNAIEGETRSYLSALIQDIANDLGEENNLPHGNSSLGSLESVQQNSTRAPQSAPDQYADGIHRIIVEELNPMMADIHRLSASVAADLEAMGVNLDPDEPQPSTSTGQSRQNNNKFDFLARNREPDSQFFANKDFWDIFPSLRNVCSDLERRLRNERNNALESESASLEDSEITPLSSDENVERELRSPLTPIIDMLSLLQVNLTFSAITVGAVRDKITQIRRELEETLSRIRNYIGARCLSHSELDIFQDMTFQLTEYMDKIVEAEDLFHSTNYFDDLFPPGLRRSSGRGTPIGFDEADLAYFNSLADAAVERNAESSSQERSSTSRPSHTTMQHSSDSSFSVRERGSVLSNQAISQSNITRTSMNRSVSVGSNLDSDVSTNNDFGLSRHRIHRRQVEAFLEFSRRTQEVCDMVTAMETSVAERDEHVTRGQTSSHNSNLSQNLHKTAPNSGGNEQNAEACSVSTERSYEEMSYEEQHAHDIEASVIEAASFSKEKAEMAYKEQIARDIQATFLEAKTPISNSQNPNSGSNEQNAEACLVSTERSYEEMSYEEQRRYDMEASVIEAASFSKEKAEMAYKEQIARDIQATFLEAKTPISNSQNPNSGSNEQNAEACLVSTERSYEEMSYEEQRRYDMEASVIEAASFSKEKAEMAYKEQIARDIQATFLEAKTPISNSQNPNSGSNEQNAEACLVSTERSYEEMSYEEQRRYDMEASVIEAASFSKEKAEMAYKEQIARDIQATFLEAKTPISNSQNPNSGSNEQNAEACLVSTERSYEEMSYEEQRRYDMEASVIEAASFSKEKAEMAYKEQIARDIQATFLEAKTPISNSQNPNSGSNERNAEACSVSTETSEMSYEEQIAHDIQATYLEARTPISNSHNPVCELSVGEIEVSSSSVNLEHSYPSTSSEVRDHNVTRNQQHQRSSFEARYHRHLSSSIETRRQRQRRIQRASETISLEHQRSPGTRSLSSRIIDLITSQNIDTEAPSRTFNTASSFLSSRNLLSNDNVLHDLRDRDSVNISSQSASELVQTSSSTLSLSNDTEDRPVSNEELNPSDNLQTTNTSQSMQPADENLVRPLWPPPIRRNSFITVYPPGNRHMDVASQSTQTPTTSMQTSESAEQSQPADLSDFSEEEMSWSLIDGTNTSPASSPEESDLDFFNLNLRSPTTRSALRDIIDRLPITRPRPALLSPSLGASLEPISDPSSDDSERPITPPILMYSPNFTNLLFSRNPRVAFNDPLTQNHRIQVWDFTHFQLPAIYEASTNVVVKRCMIHNDASIDISQDGEKLVALIPPEDRDPFNNLMFGIFSLRPGQIGRILCIWGYISNAISVSFSPLAQYVIVGSAYSRPVYSNPEKTAVAQIIKINQNEDLYDASYIRSFTQVITNENRFQQISLNCVRWLPQSGLGIVYATNRGALCICKPVAGELRDHPNDENESIRDPRSSIYWVNTVNWALMRMWNNDEI